MVGVGDVVMVEGEGVILWRDFRVRGLSEGDYWYVERSVLMLVLEVMEERYGSGGSLVWLRVLEGRGVGWVLGGGVSVVIC